MSAEKNACVSAGTLTQAAENRRGHSDPIHNFIFYFIITAIRSQIFHVMDSVFDRRPRNAPLNEDSAVVMEFTVDGLECLKRRSERQR